MKKTKIDWCDCTVNPVVGCANGCAFCYARKLNTRFKWIPDWNKPQFFPERLKDFYCQAPKSIFIDSMSDIGTWEEAWLAEVAQAVLDNPQHSYIALTKRENLLSNKLINLTEWNENFGRKFFNKVFWGVSVCTQGQADGISHSVDFFSIEPILEPIKLLDRAMPKTLIIGAETGNRKGKVIPQKEWIESLVRQADAHNCAVFMKESLRAIMGDDFRQDELPWRTGAPEEI